MDDPAPLDGEAMTRPVIYIAGPYTAGDPAANVHRAVDIAHYLMDHGLAWPLVPHLSHLWHLIAPRLTPTGSPSTSPSSNAATDSSACPVCRPALTARPTGAPSTASRGLVLTEAWAADSTLGLRSWIEEHWPNGETADGVERQRRGTARSQRRTPSRRLPDRPVRPTRRADPFGRSTDAGDIAGLVAAGCSTPSHSSAGASIAGSPRPKPRPQPRACCQRWCSTARHIRCRPVATSSSDSATQETY